MLDRKDGQPFSAHFGEICFFTGSGVEESPHDAHLQGNRLAARFAALSFGESFCIAETRFGSGLNFLCAWQLFEQVAAPGASLDFFGVENFPLNDDELRAALAPCPELAALAEVLLARWKRRVPGWNRWSFAGGRVRLTLAITCAAEALPQLPAGRVDAWLLDGFSPAKNPEMWSEVMRASSRSASAISDKEGRAPRTALVIGGGIAGCAAAHALAQRGIAVTLIERAPQLASAASGNPRGILHARFGAGDNPLYRFVLAAYGHALGLLDGALPVDEENRAECGLLQLACKPVEQKRIARLAAQEWPEHLLQFVDAEQAGRLTGMTMQYGGLWFPAGGWVVPPLLCAQLAGDTRITQRLGHDVENLEKTETGWRVSGVDAQGLTWGDEADVVLVCCAHAAKKLAPFAHFPLIAVRGQISAVPETAASKALQAVVCGDGYCAPSGHGVHVIGATHAFDDETTELRAAEHAENLASLAEYAPALRQALGAVDATELSGRAAIRCSAPGSMPLVGEVQPDLYCSLAHGTRGLLTAGIAGEVLAAQICSSLPPLPKSILDALDPLLRVRHQG